MFLFGLVPHHVSPRQLLAGEGSLLPPRPCLCPWIQQSQGPGFFTKSVTSTKPQEQGMLVAGSLLLWHSLPVVPDPWAHVCGRFGAHLVLLGLLL